MEWWQITNAGFIIAAVILAGLGAIGVIMAARKFGDFRLLAPKFLCTQCNRYYHDVEHLRCHQQ